jgi:pimeloyl-ACP methyl ester carboxylesterase
LAERIPNVSLQIIQGGGHQFLVEHAGTFNRAVLDFLEAMGQGMKELGKC